MQIRNPYAGQAQNGKRTNRILASRILLQSSERAAKGTSRGTNLEVPPTERPDVGESSIIWPQKHDNVEQYCEVHARVMLISLPHHLVACLLYCPLAFQVCLLCTRLLWAGRLVTECQGSGV